MRGKPVELVFRQRERVVARGVARAQPRLAHRVRNLEEMETGGHARGLGERPHPATGLDRVGREVEHHRNPGPEQRGHVRGHRLPQGGGAAQVILQGLHLRAVERGEPGILRDHQRIIRRPQPRGQGRFARGGLAADEVEDRGGAYH